MGIKKPKLGLSLMPTDDFQLAAIELFQDDKVDALEWSFDFSLGEDDVDLWCRDLLDEFSKANALRSMDFSYWTCTIFTASL
jgi:hypothetical protein